MAIPLRQTIRVGAYVLGRHLRGVERYPLVLMLEPLFRCNLACAGCGKIDYPDPILNQRLSVDECLGAVDECGAPIVVLAGGEPLLHRDIAQIVAGHHRPQEIRLSVHQRAAARKKARPVRPNPYFAWTVHLDGDREEHDRSVSQDGVYERAVAAIGLAKARGFRVNINATLFDTAEPERVADFFDRVSEMGIDGITVSPGYAYERAPDQEHFLNRQRTKELFRGIFARREPALVVQPVEPVSRFSRRQPILSLHPVGQPDPQFLRLAAPLLPARRGLRQDLQGTDGGDRLGRLRHRQLREMRRLHGA